MPPSIRPSQGGLGNLPGVASARVPDTSAIGQSLEYAGRQAQGAIHAGLSIADSIADSHNRETVANAVQRLTEANNAHLVGGRYDLTGEDPQDGAGFLQKRGKDAAGSPEAYAAVMSDVRTRLMEGMSQRERETFTAAADEITARSSARLTEHAALQRLKYDEEVAESTSAKLSDSSAMASFQKFKNDAEFLQTIKSVADRDLAADMSAAERDYARTGDAQKRDDAMSKARDAHAAATARANEWAGSGTESAIKGWQADTARAWQYQEDFYTSQGKSEEFVERRKTEFFEKQGSSMIAMLIQNGMPDAADMALQHAGELGVWSPDLVGKLKTESDRVRQQQKSAIMKAKADELDAFESSVFGTINESGMDPDALTQIQSKIAETPIYADDEKSRRKMLDTIEQYRENSALVEKRAKTAEITEFENPVYAVISSPEASMGDLDAAIERVSTSDVYAGHERDRNDMLRYLRSARESRSTSLDKQANAVINNYENALSSMLLDISTGNGDRKQLLARFGAEYNAYLKSGARGERFVEKVQSFFKEMNSEGAKEARSVLLSKVGLDGLIGRSDTYAESKGGAEDFKTEIKASLDLSTSEFVDLLMRFKSEMDKLPNTVDRKEYASRLADNLITAHKEKKAIKHAELLAETTLSMKLEASALEETFSKNADARASATKKAYLKSTGGSENDR